MGSRLWSGAGWDWEAGCEMEQAELGKKAEEGEKARVGKQAVEWSCGAG